MFGMTSNDFQKFCIFGLFMIIIVVCMKLNYQDKQIDSINRNMQACLTRDEYLEHFNGLIEMRLQGKDVSILASQED